MVASLERLLAVARGAEPADLVLRRAQLVNVFSGEIHPAEVAICDGLIAGVGTGYEGREIVDLDGAFLAPGFIDAHVHVESSMVPPREFARAVLPRGVTTAVTDPHEIANVAGLAGIRFMLDQARDLPFTMLVNASSCVPATDMGTAGAKLDAADLAALAGEPGVLGLAEVMNFPGVVSGDPSLLAKIEAFGGRVIDGHCPGLRGRELSAYVAAGIGSDHECTSVEEAREKLRLGMTIYIREATNARNLRALLPLVSAETERHLCFCTDDRQPGDLLEEGSIDHLVRMAIAEGVHPVTAIRMATLNPAEHFRLFDRGAVAPGRRADLVVFRELEAPRPSQVYVAGRLVAQDGKLAVSFPPPAASPAEVQNTVRIDWSRVDLSIPAKGEKVRVIGAIPDQLITEHLVVDAPLRDGLVQSDPERDLLKMAVIERHRGSGNVGLGLVKGVGLKRGAIAGTVAHDHHNLVVIGADDRSMLTAARAVAQAGGGQAVAEGEKVIALLPLPIAGLMSDLPIEKVRDRMASLISAARALGSPLHDPFMAMSFLALEVIPKLKLTDRGLVDVERFQLVPLFVSG
ncbi:Adenine deaminase [bacterium HR33]|nr:Adenine deaminase [bacterium HR33]